MLNTEARELTNWAIEGGYVANCANFPEERLYLIENCLDHFVSSSKCWGVTMTDIRVKSYAYPFCKSQWMKSFSRPHTKNHFSTDKDNWWKNLPTKIIPFPAGITNSEGSRLQGEFLKELASKSRVLGGIKIVKISELTNTKVVMILAKTENEGCGVIIDKVEIERRTFTDVDNDGVAEAIVTARRPEGTGTCIPGSGSSLGGVEYHILSKQTETSDIEIISVYDDFVARALAGTESK